MGKYSADIKKHGHQQDQYPISIADARALTMTAAGYDAEAVGAFMRAATEKLIQKLEATKVQFFSHEGIVIEERVVEDTTSQLKAAEALADIGMDVMALRRRASGDNPTPAMVNVDLSGWTVQSSPPVEKDVKDVTPGN